MKTKKNHLALISAINQAISLCGNEFALKNTRNLLQIALSSVGKAIKKRNKSAEWANKFAEDAKKLNDKWWNQIKENIKKSMEVQLEEQKNQDNTNLEN